MLFCLLFPIAAFEIGSKKPAFSYGVEILTFRFAKKESPMSGKVVRVSFTEKQFIILQQIANAPSSSQSLIHLDQASRRLVEPS